MPDDAVHAGAFPQTGAPTQANAPATIARFQHLQAQEALPAVTEQALRLLLNVLDPQPNDRALTYQEVLERLQTVITRELHAQRG